MMAHRAEMSCAASYSSLCQHQKKDINLWFLIQSLSPAPHNSTPWQVLLYGSSQIFGVFTFSSHIVFLFSNITFLLALPSYGLSWHTPSLFETLKVSFVQKWVKVKNNKLQDFKGSEYIRSISKSLLIFILQDQNPITIVHITESLLCHLYVLSYN